MILEGHAGWVRSLAASGRWLFSCGCGGIKQWDLSRAVPRCVATVSLPKGDVSALAATTTALFAGGADGSLCVWRLPTSRKNEGGVGALKKDAPPDVVIAGAHAGRVSALAVVNSGSSGNQIVSASHDGSLALWSLCVEGSAGPGEEEEEACCVTHAEQEANEAAAEGERKAKKEAKLVLVSRVSEAHGVVREEASSTSTAAAPVPAPSASAAVPAVAPASDASIPVIPAVVHAPAPSAAAPVPNKVHAAVVASDGLLYSGGDDGLVARWVVSKAKNSSDSSLNLLSPAASGPLHGHAGSPVRALAAGPGDALVSGDAAGNVLLWKL